MLFRGKGLTIRIYDGGGRFDLRIIRMIRSNSRRSAFSSFSRASFSKASCLTDFFFGKEVELDLATLEF